jgi:micrococcal nuclease
LGDEVIALLVCASLTAVDGDTVKCDGQNLRDMGDGAPFVSGYDTPEIGRNAGCDRENTMGRKAKRRMAELLKTPGLIIEDSGQVDRYDRPLVVLRLPDGRTIGSVLLAEGLAVEWRPGGDFDWCG